MLETIRAYAGERFVADRDAEAVRARHHRRYLGLAQRHASQRALWAADRKQHLAHVDADIENLHAALAWTIGRGDAQAALIMCNALAPYWLMRDRYAEAVDWIDRLGKETEAIARILRDPALLAEILQVRAVHEGNAGHADLSRRLADEALQCAHTAGDDWQAGLAAATKTIVARNAVELRAQVDAALPLLERTGNVYAVANMLASSAYSALSHGSDADAADFVARATPIARDLDNAYLWMLLRGNAGLAALFRGDADAAEEAFREELEICRELAVPSFAGEGLNGLAAVASVRGDLIRAAWLHGAADAHRYGQALDPVDERLHATFIEPARERVGPEAWDAAVRRGAATSFADATAGALREADPSSRPDPSDSLFGSFS